MHVLDFKHEFGINPHILPQVFINGIHKITEFAPRNVVKIPWNKFGLDVFLKEFPNVAMVLPFILSQCLPPCSGIAFQIGLGKLHDQMSSNFGGMYIILHFGKPNIHNLLLMGTIKVLGLGRLKPCTLG
jgi:hypothetical protein